MFSYLHQVSTSIQKWHALCESEVCIGCKSQATTSTGIQAKLEDTYCSIDCKYILHCTIQHLLVKSALHTVYVRRTAEVCGDVLYPALLHSFRNGCPTHVCTLCRTKYNEQHKCSRSNW